jgi:signal peptidase I
VKRIAGLPGTVGPADLPIPEHELYLLGDNAERSRDSRAFGPVPTAALVGVAWFRYAPAERRGSLTG